VCILAMNKKDSFSVFLDNSMAGTIAPKIFPKCGVPVACIPVRILDMILFFIFKQN
jgi:hypothetical protein